MEEYRSPDPNELGKVQMHGRWCFIMLVEPDAMYDWESDYEVVEGIDDVYVLVNEDHFKNILRVGESTGIDDPVELQEFARGAVLSNASAVFKDWLEIS